MADSSLPTNLEALAESWSAQLLSLAQENAPAHIRPYIFNYVENSDGRYIIRITVNRSANPRPKNGSMDARAQEYGSGLRARRGEQGYIQIRPTSETGWLIFQGTNEYSGMVIKTKEVQHPGIEAYNGGQGYIAPAINELRKTGRAELSASVRAAILSDIRRSFGGRVK
jgi:hypothetical protein